MATPQESNEEGIICSILEQHHSSLTRSMKSPYTVVNICQILYSKRSINERALDEVESPDTALENKKDVLLAAVNTGVFMDHRKLHELATVLDQFEETKSVANNILNDYNLKIVKKAASEAVRRNIVDLNNAISASFENYILTCEQETLISSDFKTNLLDSSTNKTTRCSNLITHIQNLVGVQPAHLDTFLCILNGKDLFASEVANSVATSYGHNLPKYERIRAVGGATSVVSSDDNVEEMVPQYDQMSNEDRASDILRTHYSTLSQSLNNPVNIARLLHGENIISEDAVVTQVITAAIKDRTTVLLRSVRRAVHGNHQHLKVFGRVLQQLTAGNERVGQDILNDYNKIFSGKNEIHISHEMEEEFTAIKAKFGFMCTKIMEEFLANNISLTKLKSCCKFTYTNLSHQVESCQTMEDVLIFVAKKCTLIKIRLLKEFVEFCNVNEAKQHILDYQQAIDDFSEKMRARFPLNQSLLPDGTPQPLRGETITFVMKWDPESVTLDDIENLLNFTYESFYDDVKLIVINKGRSVIITCAFAFELTSLLIAKATINLKVLKQKGLQCLTIGYCTIYEEEKEETTDVQSTNEKVTSERERELEQPLNLKRNEIVMDITDQESNQAFPSQTTPPSLSETPSDKQMLKQQIKAMAMEIETLKSNKEILQVQQLENNEREVELLQEKISIQSTQLLDSQQNNEKSTSDNKDEKSETLTSDTVLSSDYSLPVKEVPPSDPKILQLSENKKREVELLQEKISSLQSTQLLDSQQKNEKLPSDNKDLQFQNEKNETLMSDTVVSSNYSLPIKKVPPSLRILKKVPAFVQEDVIKATDGQIRNAVFEILDEIKNGELKKYEKEQHFLFIGRYGTGKTSLAGVLIGGESGEGYFGGKAGTTELTTTPITISDDVKYYVHDTRGLGDTDSELSVKEKQFKEIYEQNKKCLVIVCIRWDDRFNDYNSLLALNVCNSLGDDVWSNAVIAITHCDILPPDIVKDQQEKAAFIQRIKSGWISLIENELSKLKVSDDIISNIPICFTSHTALPCEVEPEWVQKLYDALIATGKLDKSFANMKKRIAVSHLQYSPNSPEADSDKTDGQHFLFIGRSGTGKSSLAGVLIDGESANVVNYSVELVNTKTYKRGDAAYHVHDTRSLGNRRIKPEVILENIKKIYEKFNCLIVVCIRWDDLYYEIDTTLALEACNSLGDDVWSKAIIAITHCDRLPPVVSDKSQYIKEKKQSWKEFIVSELCRLKVHEDVAQKVQICFTSHTAIPNCEVEPEWRNKLYEALMTTSRADRSLADINPSVNYPQLTPKLYPPAEPQHKAPEAKQEKPKNLTAKLKDKLARNITKLANGAYIFIENKCKKATEEQKLQLKLEEISSMELSTEDGYTIGPALCTDLEKGDLTVVAISVLIWLHL